MKRHSFAVGLASAASTAIVLSLAMFGSVQQPAQAEPPEGVPPLRYITGDATLVNGSLIVSWAGVLGNEVKVVGVTIPVAVFDQPPEGGDGPAGAFASLRFPEIVQETTYFNHVEMGWNPAGHQAEPGSLNPLRNFVPHFDFHFYAIDEAEVWLIPGSPVPGQLLPQVPPERLPDGYMQPGSSVPQMGRHSSPSWVMTDPGFLSTIMIAGFLPPAATHMHFLEPMVSRERLLERTSFELPVPMPEEFGRTMRYPTRFVAVYDADLDAYHFVFGEFVSVE